MSALNQTHIVQCGIGSNVDYHHHLTTLTVQTPQMSISCPLTFDVVNGLHCDIVLGADWFDQQQWTYQIIFCCMIVMH